jgi:DNA-binding beta-propeller fold protein YncE
VVLGVPGGVGAIDAANGAVLSLVPGAVAEPDRTHVDAATASGGLTRIDRIATATGVTESSVSVSGDLQIRAVAPFGSAVAMMPATETTTDSWAPQPRARTHIVVAHPDGSDEPQRYSLNGNFEPEAFSPDGETLFMLQYRPALAPTSYRVTGLYLESGRHWALIGPDKQPVENMTATRLVQVESPDGAHLYTLYTNQRPSYLGEPTTPLDPGEQDERAFVHTVDLRNGFAVCIELPDRFGSVPQEDSALAISPDGNRVYAVDARHGTIAAVNVRRFRVAQVTDVDLSALGAGQIHAQVASDGSTLYVAGDAGLLQLDTATLAVRGGLVATPAPVTGLAISGDGARLYLSYGALLQRLDAATLEPAQPVPLANAGWVEAVSSV